jgi:GT2 family glycosyltransferase
MREVTNVGVVLLNWNGAEFTIPCIESLYAGRMRPCRIVVVDNGSVDGSAEKIRARFPLVELIRNPENLGAAAGRNVGIRPIVTGGVDAVLLLDNDTVVARDCLEAMVAELNSEPEVAVATGKIMLADPPDRIWYAGADWHYAPFRPPHDGQNSVDTGLFDTKRDVGFAPTCCMLVRCEAFRQVGLFCERYWVYWEDAEWCLRAQRAGLRMRYVPDAVLWHKVSGSFRKNTLGASRGTASASAHYLITRNRLVTIRKYAGRPLQASLAIAIVLLGSLYRIAGLTVLGRWEKLGALWRGLFEGLTCSLASWDPPAL